MDSTAIKRRQGELSAQQQAYTKKRAMGHSRQESAIMAGYSEDNPKAGAAVERSPDVQMELARLRAETAEAVGVTKEDIAAMMMESYTTARVMADPQAMVRAAAELGKLLGHYAPEVKKHVHRLDPNDRAALKAMSDEELQKLARGRVIDVGKGDVTEVE